MELHDNADFNQRGLHIIVINPNDGEVEFGEVFDTYKSSFELDQFINFDVIPDGHIVVAACQDDCITALSETGKSWFSDMGSKEINNLQYRCGFSFIGIKGKKT